LDLQAFDRVGVVAGPALRGEGEHPRIEAPAARGAGFEEYLGKGPREAIVELVDAEHIAVEELALTLRREREAVRLRDVAVHVPFDVGDGSAR
jgi:hypothetical protein